jgi:hypothetical protein
MLFYPKEVAYEQRAVLVDHISKKACAAVLTTESDALLKY